MIESQQKLTDLKEKTMTNLNVESSDVCVPNFRVQGLELHRLGGVMLCACRVLNSGCPWLPFFFFGGGGGGVVSS